MNNFKLKLYSIIFIFSLHILISFFKNNTGIIFLVINIILLLTLIILLHFSKFKFRNIISVIMFLLYIIYFCFYLLPKYQKFEFLKNQIRNEFQELKKSKIKKININTYSYEFSTRHMEITDRKIIGEFLNSLDKCKRKNRSEGKGYYYYITFFDNNNKPYSLYFVKTKDSSNNSIELFEYPHFDVFDGRGNIQNFDSYYCKQFADLIVKYVDEYIRENSPVSF